MNPCKCGWYGDPGCRPKYKADLFPHTPGYDLFPCTADIQAIGSFHVEKVVLEVVQEKWNSFDIDLSEHKNLDLTSIFQNQFAGYSAQSEFSVDNVYFWKDGTSTQLDAAAMATKVSKTIENGQVVIIRDGVKYNVVGAVIEK